MVHISLRRRGILAESRASQQGARGSSNKLCGRPPQYAPAPCKLTTF